MRKAWFALPFAIACMYLFILTLPVSVQSQGIGNAVMKHYPSTPTGGCSRNQLAMNDATGSLYNCLSGAWNAAGGGGGISGLSANCVPKAATATTITGCSSLSDDGTTLTTSNATVTSSSASPLFITSTSGDVLLSNTAETHAFGLEGAVYGDFPGGSGQPGRFQVDLDTDYTHIELLESTRLAPTLSGCSFTAQSSNTGFLAGSYHSGTTGTCTVTFTMPTVTTGWYCSGKDITTPADVINTTASSASGCTLSGTTTTGDVIVWTAMAF